MSRPPFLKHIEQAWTESIESDYDSHAVLSERTLQASIWAKLRAKANGQYIFIEPKIYLPPIHGNLSTHVIPDLLVCRGESVIAVIELKFTPRVKADLRSDIQKLRKVRDAKEPLSIELERFRGVQAKAHKYRTTESTQYVLGYVSFGVPRGLSEFLAGLSDSTLAGRLTVLGALTQNELTACITRERL